MLVDAGHALGRDGLYKHLREQGIVARRYFHPLISDFPMYRNLPSADPARLPAARAAADQVLCLPIYPALQNADVERIAGLVRESAVAVAPPMLLAA